MSALGLGCCSTRERPDDATLKLAKDWEQLRLCDAKVEGCHEPFTADWVKVLSQIPANALASDSTCRRRAETTQLTAKCKTMLLEAAPTQLFISCIANLAIHAPAPLRDEMQEVLLEVAAPARASLPTAQKVYWYLHTAEELMHDSKDQTAASEAGRKIAKDLQERIEARWKADRPDVNFQANPTVWKRLCDVSIALVDCVREQRVARLVTYLQRINLELLPDKDVYVPLVTNKGDEPELSGSPREDSELLSPRSRGQSQVSVREGMVRIPLKFTTILHSKDRAPYHLLLEQAPVTDSFPPPHGSKTEQKPPEKAPEPELETADETNIDYESDEEAAIASLEKDEGHGLFKGQTFAEVSGSLRKESEFGDLSGWNLRSIIVKSGADLRQEEIAVALIHWFDNVFRKSNLKLWLRPFEIVCVGSRFAVMETVIGASSLHDLKMRRGDAWTSLADHFRRSFPNTASPDSPAPQKGVSSARLPNRVPLSRALTNFMRSMAGYSVLCYCLAIRDRHNGNIMIDEEGHVVHCDFGFMLCNTPGGVYFEPRNFKLTSELVDVLGGVGSPLFVKFKEAVVAGMLVVRRYAQELILLLQMYMIAPENRELPGFSNPDLIREELSARLFLGKYTEEQFREFVGGDGGLVDQAVDNIRTLGYDWYQSVFTGIRR
mmetsp:Transcript_31235/g.81022  ORF Transcript_31235/g.81022 Transcript_31235/m.81022 type:complete len:664 (-) Transcript_31235:188-2179(-)